MKKFGRSVSSYVPPLLITLVLAAAQGCRGSTLGPVKRPAVAPATPCVPTGPDAAPKARGIPSNLDLVSDYVVRPHAEVSSPAVARAASSPLSSVAIVEPPTLPVPLAVGWNFSGKSATPLICVTAAQSTWTPRDVYATAGAFSDTSTLAKGLKLTASAQASFLAGGASVETSYILEQKATSSHERIAIYASIRDLQSLAPNAPSPVNALSLLRDSAKGSNKSKAWNTQTPADAPLSVQTLLAVASEGISLSPHALTILKTEGRAAFAAKCGQGYVAGIESGADLVGFYQFDSSNVETKRQVKVGLKGHYLGQSASLGLDSTVSGLNQTSMQLIGYNQWGGSPAQLPMDKAGFLAAITAFPSTLPAVAANAHSTGKIYALHVASYGPSTVSNWPANMAPFSPAAETPLAKLVEQYWLLTSIYDQLGEVIGSPESYILNWGISLADVKVHQSEVLQTLQSLNVAIAKCSGAEDCASPVPMPTAAAYYAHLARVPLPATWSPEYSDLKSTLQAAISVVDKFNKDHKDLVDWSQAMPQGSIYRPGADKTCYKRNNLNHTVMDKLYLQNVKPVLDGLRSRDDNFTAQLRQALRTTALEETNAARCALSPLVFGCASAVDLDAYAQLMPATGPHHVSTNEGDEHVYGECPWTGLVMGYNP